MSEKLPEMNPAEILVVDDIPANLKLLTDILTERGYRVRPAPGGRLALRSAAIRPPDLILLDVKMPDMDGYEVCRALKSNERGRDIPVIFISALDETQDKVKGFEAGGVDFITKPFQAEEVLVRVATHLALRRLQDSIERQNAQLQMEIADRKQAEDALRRSENTYRTIFETTGTALVILQEDTVISFANTQFERLSGYSREEIEGRMSWTAFAAPDDMERMKINHDLRRIDPHAAPASYEFQFVDRQGGTRSVVANVATIPETRKSVASLMDVSELRRMEAELREAREWESIGIFAGGIAHDFNNLLGIVLGNICLAEMHMSSPDTDVRKYLKEAERVCLQSKELTQRLIALTWGRGPGGVPQSVVGLIANAVVAVLRDSHVSCDLDLAEDLWHVDCDATQIMDAISNILMNAEEATVPGGTIEVAGKNELIESGSIPGLQPGKYVHLSVMDHGKGIPKELLPRIYDPYFSTKERGAQKGMGLGLTMAYAVIKRHNGHISVDSEVGLGTTVDVYLPAEQV